MLKSFAYTILGFKLPLLVWVGLFDVLLMWIAVFVVILNKKGIKILHPEFHYILGGIIVLISMFVAVCALSGYWNF